MKLDDLLKKYADGKCTAEEENAVRKWLTTHVADPAYDKVFEDLLNDTVGVENKLSQERVNRHLNEVIYNDLRTRKTKKSKKLFYSIANVAACAIFVFGMLLFNNKNEEDIIWNEVHTERGETKTLSLADGTSLWINSGTKVIYPSSFDGKTRNIFVDGEIYADVTRDKKKPFVVSASGINVKVHGTQFSVKAFAEMKNVEVALISGSVTVSDANDESRFSRTLVPGELIRYNKPLGTIEEYAINTKTFGAWQDNHNIRFINQSLIEIANDLERRFNVNILIEDPELEQTLYYASFINNEGLDKILNALNSNHTLKISKRNDTIIISSNK